jgi:hypothetical protein
MGASHCKPEKNRLIAKAKAVFCCLFRAFIHENDCSLDGRINAV